MDSVELYQNGDCIEDISAEKLLSLDSSDACDCFGDPEVVIRVGDQYQVEIPSLITESDYLSYTKNPIDEENSGGVPGDFLMGLPIPIMQINKEVDNMKHETLEFFGDSNDAPNENGPSHIESVRGTQFFSKDEDSKFKVETSDVILEANLALKGKLNLYRGPDHCLVPGSCGDSWSVIEKASFLLGLYIFEKNFIQVERFMESKKMGDILSFYYGKFYRSDEYRRWSECRKMRSKRCVYGQRIFSGFRQHELLSRLFLNLSEECQNDLLEVSKTFGEGKLSLEEYVSSLKAMVGINVLVEVVGIGKGKQDLTSITMEPSKSNQVIHLRPEVPTGKACSSLTPTEIIKFLTGDYRLSKARSNDLFWEAVWPRLLARGWHSEQPKNQGYATGSKHSLVFLMPGVKKFSRRKLVKGNHYFDSVSDVLSKVASEPGLIELDIGEDEGNRSKEEHGWTDEIKFEQDDLPKRKHHSYLQPRTPSRNTDGMKFTIVDTSLATGKTFKVRELRILPVEISKELTSKIHSEDSDEDASEFSTDESDCTDTMLLDQKETNNTEPMRIIPDTGMSYMDSTNVVVKNSKNHSNLCKDKQTRKSVKCHLRPSLKQDIARLAPVSKQRRRLTSCSRAETSHGMISFSEAPGLEQEMCRCYSKTLDLAENIVFHVGSSQDKSSSTSSPKGIPIESIDGTHGDNHHGGAEHPCEKPQPRTLIDLNLPQFPPDFGTGGQDDYMSKEPDNPNPLKTSVGVESSEQQPNMNSRRHGTRNRPPTARALEAVANGFLTINRRRKRKEASARENSTSRPSQRAHGGVWVTEFSTDDASMANGGGNGGCNGDNSNMLGKFQVMSMGSGTKIPGS